MQNGKGRSYLTILITKVLNSFEAELLLTVFKNFSIFLIALQTVIVSYLFFSHTQLEIDLLKRLDLEEIGLQVAILSSILIYSYAVYAITSARSLVVTYLFIGFIIMNLVNNQSIFFTIYLFFCIGSLKAVHYYRRLELSRVDKEQDEEDEYYY